MDITPYDGTVPLIRSYGPGRFRVMSTTHQGHLLLYGEHSRSWLGPLEEKAKTFIEEALALHPPDVILVGTGRSLEPLPPWLKALARPGGFGVEPMDTGAACRTYNVLAIEGRHVLGLLAALPEGPAKEALS